MNSSKKLSLRRETLTELATDDLRLVAGGALTIGNICDIVIGPSVQTCGQSCGGDCCSIECSNNGVCCLTFSCVTC